MSKNLIHCLALAAFMLFGQAHAQAYLPDTTEQTLGQFEHQRAQLCFNTARDIQQLYLYRDGDPSFAPQDGIDYDAALTRLRDWEMMYSGVCSTRNVRFIRREVEALCPLDKLPNNPFCTNYAQFANGDPQAFYQVFGDSYDSFRTLQVGWGWLPVKGEGRIVARGYTYRGNLKFVAELQTVSLAVNDPKLANLDLDEIVAFQSNTRDHVVIPILVIQGVLTGLTNDGLSVQVVVDGRGGPMALHQAVTLGWAGLHYFEAPLTPALLEVLGAGHTFRLNGVSAKTGEQVVTMQFENQSFGRIYEEIFGAARPYKP